MEDIAAIEGFERVGAFLEHRVMHREGAGNPRHATNLRVAQTGQPDQIARIGMRRQLLLVAVGARQRVLAAEILDVTEPVAEYALRQPAPEMGAEAPEDHAELV